jgi:hypothetical protein
VATACGTVHQKEMFLWEKQKNITLFKLERKNFPNWRGNKICCKRKGNSFPEREKYRSYGKTLM